LFEIRFYPCAERFLDKCSKEDKQKLIGAAEGLATDPYVDGESKFILQAPPVMLRIFYSSTHWIVYHLHESASLVQIFNMGRRGVDRRSFRCPEVE
jgi:hypothetical protein